MMGKKSFHKNFVLALVGLTLASLAPKLSQATVVAADDSQDAYLKNLVDNLKTVELAPDYQKALADLKASTADCSSLKQWSNPDESANLVVKKNIESDNNATPGPVYSVSLSFPQVQPDTFNVPVQIFTNPSLMTATSLKKFYKKTLEAVKDATRANRYVCSKLADDDSDKSDDSQKLSSN
jgi:hypothetical protein